MTGGTTRSLKGSRKEDEVSETCVGRETDLRGRDI